MIIQKLSEFQTSNIFKPNLLASFLALAIIATGQTSLAHYYDSDTCEDFPALRARKIVSSAPNTHAKFRKLCKKEKNFKKLASWMVKKSFISSEQRDELGLLLKPLDLNWKQRNKLIFKFSQHRVLTVPHLKALALFIKKCDAGSKYHSVQMLTSRGFTSVDEIEAISSFNFRDFDSCINALDLWRQQNGSLSLEMINTLIPIIDSVDIGNRRHFITKLTECGVSSPSELENFPLELGNNLEKIEDYFSLRDTHEAVGEWRPETQDRFSKSFRDAMRSLLFLGKTESATPANI